MRLARLVAPFALAALLAGCAAPVAPSPVAAPDAVVVDAGAQGDRAVTIGLASAPFRTQAIHRWVEADIYQYEVTLQVKEGDAFVDLPGLTPVVVPRKGEAPKTRAVFTHLKHNKVYRATVVARGNVGGTAATEVLNADAPSTVEFDFTRANDEEAAKEAEVRVKLDDAEFSGTGAITILPPVEGAYDSDPTAVSGGAQ